jgi:hypothetical protein
VEGYTHFLWLCIITFLQWLGISPESTTVWLGLAAYAATLLLFLWTSRRIDSSDRFVVPFVTIVLALHFDLWIWATGGLEASFFTFLISLGVVVICYVEIGSASRFLFSGLIFTLSALTRPDGLMFWGIALVFLAFSELATGTSWQETLRLAGRYLAPLVLMWVPYMIWKTSYYGYIFPNTYYAKSGGISYYGQGFLYIWTYLRVYTSTFLIMLVIPFLIGRWLKYAGTSMIDRVGHLFFDPNVKAVLLGTAFIFAYGIFFVARVGGDFMYARFLHVLIPLFYLMISVSLVGLLGHKRMLLNLSMAAVLLIVLSDKNRRDSYLGDRAPFGPGAFDRYAWIIDEHWYWTHDLGNGENRNQLQSRVGKELRSVFEGLDVTVVLWGQDRLAYYAKFRTCIESAGLTDTYIAHLPLDYRKRPGHEKLAPWDYMVSRRANFVFLPGSSHTPEFRKFSLRCNSDSVWGFMVTYDRDLLLALERRLPGKVTYVKFEEYLDTYIQQMKTKKISEVRADLKDFDDYYFRWVNDERRRSVFRSYLDAQASSLHR